VEVTVSLNIAIRDDLRQGSLAENFVVHEALDSVVDGDRARASRLRLAVTVVKAPRCGCTHGHGGQSRQCYGLKNGRHLDVGLIVLKAKKGRRKWKGGGLYGKYSSQIVRILKNAYVLNIQIC
jgi:hypothetical protein